jgi:hypothetical protein
MTRYERSLPVLAMLALTFGALAGMHASTAQAAIGIDIDVAPPAPRVEVVPAPRAGFVWAPGYWRWNGHAHAWHNGYWIKERRGYHWVPDAWVGNGPHYHYARGHWER